MRPPRAVLLALVVTACLTAVIVQSRRIAQTTSASFRDASLANPQPALAPPAPTPSPAKAPLGSSLDAPPRLASAHPVAVPSGPPSTADAAIRSSWPPFEAPAHAFRAWIASRLAHGGTLSSQDFEEGLALARARGEVMRALIPTQPKRALELALPWQERQTLPEALAAVIEQPLAARGEWLVLCARRASSMPLLSFTERWFRLEDRSYRCFVFGRRLLQQSTPEAVLHGIAIDDLLAVAEEPLRIPDPAERTALLAHGVLPATVVCAVSGIPLDPRDPPVLVQHGATYLALAKVSLLTDLNARLAAVEPGFRRPTEPPSFQQATHGTKRALFMRARFPDDLREPVSVAEATEVMRGANEFFVANSFNSFSLVSTIGPLVTLPQPKLYYAVRGPGALRDDALAATRLAGVDPQAFDLDLVRFEPVPGFSWAGLAAVGGRGNWLQSSDLGVVVHELGHNLGLSHANFWNTTRPDFPDDIRNLPFDPDSEVGIDSIIGPGDDVEYGDPFDVMGGGGGTQGHFSGLHKRLLGWVPDAGLITLTNEGSYSLRVHDLGVTDTTLPHLLRIPKDAERSYWISARARFDANPWLSQGVEIHWNNWHQAIGSTELLDTTPGSAHERQDAAITLGRTFADTEAQIFITPWRLRSARAGGQTVPVYDVYVAFGPFPDNRPPDLDLAASTLSANVGAPIALAATASDPDGDPLAYAWDLGDGLPGSNTNALLHQWDSAGDYVVRCEVTDFRGGVASRHLVVRVGQVSTLRISGQVVDQSGLPLAGVRVHTGLAGTNQLYAPEYRWAYTDSLGAYTLVGLPAGNYPMGAVLDGYLGRPLNFARPLVLNEFTGVGVDFIATALPQVTIQPVGDGSESPTRPVTFRITRDRATNETLRVFFRTSGSAAEDDDYTPWPNVEIQTNSIPTALNPALQTLTYGYVDLNPGITSTNLSFPVLADTEAEGDESLVVTLVYPVSRTTISETETNVVDIPGWEVLADNGQDTWFQTRPAYHLGSRAEATSRIRDASPPSDTTVSIVALETETSENPGDSASLVVFRTGRPPSGTLTIPLSVSGSATSGEDFVSLPASVTLSPNVDAVRVVLEPLDDRFVEGNETIDVTLATGAGYRLGNRLSTVTVVDNDLPSVAITTPDPVVAESSPEARIVVQRVGDLDLPLEVDYLLGGTAQSGADYQPLPGRVVIPAGASSVSLLLRPIDDNLFEGDETIDVRLGDSPIYNILPPGRTAMVLRDDEFPTVTVVAEDPQAREGDEGGSFVIERTGSTSQPLLVRYRLGGSALHQADFVASGDRVEIPAGQRQVTILVAAIDDSFREDNETIVLELVPNPAYGIGSPGSAAIELEDNDDNEPAVGFALLSSSGPESKTRPDLVVRISGNPDEGPENAVTVAWEVLGGSAQFGTDYLLTNGTVVFPFADPEGDEPLTNRVAVIPLEVINDLLPERDETLLVRLRIAPTELASEDPEAPPSLSTNGVLDVFAVHTYTILDDDLAEITVTAPVPSTAEGSDEPGRFRIARAGSTNSSQTVILFLSGLAASGSDYLEIPTVVTLPPGVASTDLLVSPVDDPIAEYRENIALTLVHAPGARLGEPAHADITLDDNDGTIEFTSARPVAGEGDGVAHITVRRTGDTNLTASAVFEVTPGTAQPLNILVDPPTGDFRPTNGVLVFPPGAVTAEITIAIRDDQDVEGPETVLLRLRQGSDLFPLGGQNNAVLTLLDNDALLSSGTNVLAGIESEPEVTVTLERAGPIDEPLSVRFHTLNDTALADEDYVASEGTFVFPAGIRSASIQIPLLDDARIEGNEAFVLQLFPIESDTPIGDVRVVIVDDDCVVEFEAADSSVDEDAGVIELTVRRRGSLLNPLLVDFTTVSGTATSESDFEETSGTLEFRGNRFETLTNGTGDTVFVPGDSLQTVTVRIINDPDGERDESFAVPLTQVRPGFPLLTQPFASLGSVTNAQVTIRDNEAPGRVDDQFQPGLGADAAVRALALQSDGKLLVGGDFTTFDGVILPRIARLHADGFVDSSFNPGRGFDGSVLALTAMADGRLLVGGTFTNATGVFQPFLCRLEPDGTLSTGFHPRPDQAVHVISAGNEVFIGGDFTRVSQLTSPGVARLTPGGDLDIAFATGADGQPGVRTLVAIDDGGVMVGGVFTAWGRNGPAFLARLQPDGTRDPSYTTGLNPNGPVHALMRSADGSLYLAGEFTSIAGLSRAGVARLLPNGSPDASFDPGSGAQGAVYSLGNQDNGRTVWAGAFTSFAGEPTGRFVRLESDGRIDSAFFRGTGANGIVRSLTVQADGAFYIGGDFTQVNDRPRQRVARIHADEEFVEGFIEFESDVVTAPESAPDITIALRRSGTAKAPATVRFHTARLTASPADDYEPADQRVEFAARETRKDVVVRLRDDTLAEGSETVSLVLTNAVGALVGRQATATLVILDDEPALALDLGSASVDEAMGTVDWVVRRSGPTDSEVRVQYTTEPVTAVAPDDYLPAAGTLTFAPGMVTATIPVTLVDDTEIEPTEEFRLRLHSPSAGIALGSQSEMRITLRDNDRPPTHYSLTVEPSPGGSVVPGGGRFPTNTLVELRALPDRDFEFARWEGTLVSGDNPLLVLMDRNHVLTPRFRAREYLDTFETGDFSHLPWQFDPQIPWLVTSTDPASSGQYSARSGPVANRGTTTLSLEHLGPAGGASFDFRTASETGWDFLEFRLNDLLIERWSGVNGWQTFTFNVPAGRNRLEWRFVRDPSFGGTEDAVWIDNLDLPVQVEPVSPPSLSLRRHGARTLVRIEDSAERSHTLEVSADLANWTTISSGWPTGAEFELLDPTDLGQPIRFYRIRVP